MSPRNFVLAALITLMCATAIPGTAYTVVIDPGHGGKDLGCSSRQITEKAIVLDVAHRLGDIINAEHPGVNTLFTRSDDRFIPLADRAAIANKANADLFISIHVNSIDKRTKGREKIHGASVYALGLHRTDDNLAVAMRENSVIELEDDFTETYQGFDPASSESYIIFELTQNRHMQQSLHMAELIQHELTGTAGRADKGVRQSGFLVLRATSMPAVLVELDFICNAQAEAFLRSEKGRAQCARALANAFTAYYGEAPHRAAPSQAAPPAALAGEAQASAETPQPAAAAPPCSAAYAVQLSAVPKPIDIHKAFAGVDDVREYHVDKLYKYMAGRYATAAQAKKRLASLRKQFPGAFVTKLPAD